MSTEPTTQADSAAGAASLPDLERLFELALTIQLCDDRMQKEVKSGNIKAATYPVRGLEGVCAALGTALTRQDYMVSTYRNLGDVIAKGIPLGSVIAEICGRVTGVARGKGGAMHMADTSVGFMTTTGIVGSGLPIATGLALASKLAGDDRVTVVTFGDGATSIGAFHEAMNLATLWKLPLVFVCQNNGWGEHTPIEEYMINTDISAKARSYGLVAERVDGFDAAVTLGAVRRAIDAARSGQGPRFIEAMTYRLSGHTSTTDFSYMDKQVLESFKENDAIVRLRSALESAGAGEAVESISATATATVAEAFAFAFASEYPDPHDAYTDVFATTAREETL
ncbi:thiamine pyrophosphate-dependent dehydrogenase E1 component subunit alpha [soil metagenome]